MQVVNGICINKPTAKQMNHCLLTKMMKQWMQMDSLLHWFAALDHKEDIFEHHDTGEVSEREKEEYQNIVGISVLTIVKVLDYIKIIDVYRLHIYISHKLHNLFISSLEFCITIKISFKQFMKQ